MKDAAVQDKQNAILQSAWQAFATYGYRKTSMDDIARGAGMSRPAVYLHYRNKDDIFRSLVQHYYDTAADAVAVALRRDATPDSVLAAAFDAQLGDTMEAMLTSPHGMELLDTGVAMAADIKAAGESRLAALYAAWLRRAATNGRIRLPEPAEQVAGTIAAALKGVKANGSDFATVRARLTILARLIGQGLAADR
ncbi:helix-turn-helix domain-containing protein [Sedimentitalea sp. JM2-8]|uniref:Helix-turn-helix domain-containing protein n=1 Tax=Sedimentitalea xiamensis TaxID=3050037 RepID=A0ABT7FIP2_9RHOB|nr:TetR/AcrR family transcriptional regulator [Sedimentitalea xiamensis]MDK3074967.1 helix-turn-helix domain-containing protein [Sedimentitalea xiamensis]